MVSKTHVLVSEYNTIDTAGSTIPNIQPANPMDFGSYASRVTFIVSIAAIVGAPTAWSLGAKFQYCLPSTDGFIYSRSRWFDLQPENVAANIAEGVGWGQGSHAPPADGGFGVIADQTDTLPVTVQRTVRDFGLRVRLVLDPKFTGGTNPGVKATILAIPGA